MDENLHNIDDLFKKAINRHEEMPSASVWENIDKSLDKKKVISISQKYKKLKWVAAALLIFSAGMAMYTIHTRIKNKELVRLNNLNRKNPFKKDIGNSDASAFSNAHVDSAIKTPSDTVASNALSNENLASEQQKKEAPNSKISEQKVGITIPGERVRNSDARNNLKETEAAIAANNAGKTGKARENSVGDKGKYSTGENDEAEDKNSLISNQKQVDDVVVVGNSRKDLLQVRPPDLSFENALKNGSPINNILSVNGQNVMSATKIKGVRKAPFSATVFYSPDFVGARVDNGPRRFREDDRNEIKNKEQIKNASSFGLLLDYNVTNRLIIESGVAFSGMTTYIQPKTIYARPDDRGRINYRFNCSAGYSFIATKAGTSPAAGDSVTALSSTNTLHYVSIPLTVKYVLRKGRLSVRPGVGVAANFLTKDKIETEIAGLGGNEKANINHIDGLNKSYLSALLSVGAEYDLNKRIAISFTPVSRLALSAINKDAPVKTYLNSFSLAAGLVIKL